MTTGESLARQVEYECYSLDALLSEQGQSVPPPEHDDYRNFNQWEAMAPTEHA